MFSNNSEFKDCWDLIREGYTKPRYCASLFYSLAIYCIVCHLPADDGVDQ